MSDKSKNSINSVAAAIEGLQQRDRNYTEIERVKKLLDIYDNTLDFMDLCAATQQFKGTSAATTILERIRFEIDGQGMLSGKGTAATANNENTLGWRYKPKRDEETVEA